ncbi:MAG TPA: tripartite tricarboxylate transporter substrate-binding protein, partial [Burkholderiaceae bacterium]|nr:tripartite tricarboxylate transporter substrate-binding protein [Burkholderiaceae bacterium]
GDLLVVSPMVAAGKLRALAVTSAQRHPMYPNVPTVAESGFAGFEALSWQGVFAPAGTRAPVVNRLSTELGKILTSADLKEYFASRGFIVEARSPEATARFVQSEVDKWGRIVKAAGATAE